MTVFRDNCPYCGVEVDRYGSRDYVWAQTPIRKRKVIIGLAHKDCFDKTLPKNKHKEVSVDG